MPFSARRFVGQRMNLALTASAGQSGWDTLFLTTGMSRKDGGPFLSVSGLAKAVSASGETRVGVAGLYRHAGDWPVDHGQWAPLPLRVLPHRPLRNVWALAHALRQVVDDARREGRPLLVHASGLWNATGVALGLTGLAECSPYAISPRGMLEPWALEFRKLRKQCALLAGQRAQLASAAMLHATSDLEYESIRAFGLRNPVCVIPNGLDVPDHHDHEGSRRVGEPRRCVFLSRLHAKKGLPLLLDAWAATRPVGWTLEIAGEGDPEYVRDLKRQIAALGLLGVHFVGEQTGRAKWDFLATADLFVLPSYSENFGIAVAEAMAMGVPVITTHGTPWSILEREQMGWWIPATADALAAALQGATAEPPDVLRSRGAKGAAYARNAFGWQGIAERMIACYRWIVGQGSFPRDMRLE